jgi:hypothetical protein
MSYSLKRNFIMKYVLLIGGLLLVASAVGAEDFYLECRAAADCVAGDPPSAVAFGVKIIVGFLMMLGGGFMVLKDDEFA